MFIRRFFAFVISAFLIFYPAYAYATTSVGGWTATDSLIAGANTTINAAKTAGGKALKSAVTIAPSASKVGKYLIKGGGYAALAFAATQLVGDSVDWVLDPANNSIKYKPNAGDTAPDGTGGATAGAGYYFELSKPAVKFPTPYEACNSSYAVVNLGRVVANVSKSGDVWNCYSSDKTLIGQAGFKPDADYKPPAAGGVDSAGYKHIPIDTVAAKVIANAAAGHADSQEAVKATALEGFAAGEHDAALDAAATEVGTENPPETENPPKDPDAPAEPFDPAGIISAINALKALLAGILSSMTGFFDWFQAEPVPPEEEKEEVGFATTKDVGLDSVDRFEQRVDFRGQCPANDFSVSIFGVTYSKPIPYHYFCGFLEQIAPWLLAMCYLGTAYFVVENV